MLSITAKLKTMAATFLFFLSLSPLLCIDKKTQEVLTR
jgi:hypothetical protein